MRDWSYGLLWKGVTTTDCWPSHYYLSVQMEQHNIHEILYWVFINICPLNWIWFNVEKTEANFHGGLPKTYNNISLNFSWDEKWFKNFCWENQNKLLSNIFFYENCASCSLAEIVGLNPAGDIGICQLWVLCLLLGKGLCDGLILRREESYWYGVSAFDLETSTVRWSRSSLSVASQEINVWREY
jgi:hypothetical protein